MSASLLQSFVGEIAALLGPITRAAQSEDARARLFAQLGVLAGEDDAQLLASLQAIAELVTAVQALAAEDAASFDSVAAVLDAADRAFARVRELVQGGSPVAGAEGVGRGLVSLLAAAWLGSRHPVGREVAALLTVLEPAEDHAPRPPVVVNGEVLRLPVAIDRFHGNRLVDLLRDPIATLRAAYVNDLQTDEDAHAVANKLFRPLSRLLRDARVPCRYGINPGDEVLLGDAATLISHALIVYVNDELLGAEAEAGIVLAISPASRGDLGLVVTPFGSIAQTRSVGAWTLELELTAGVEAIAYGRHGLTLLAGPGTTEVTGRIVGTLVKFGAEPAAVLGTPDGVRLEIGSLRLALDTALSEAHQAIAVSADLSPAAFVLAPAAADGFLASLLPREGVRTDFDLGLAWSSDAGFTFRGHAGLEAIVPVGRSLAGVTLESIHLGLRARDGLLAGEVSASLGACLGPVRVRVDRFGIEALAAFPEDGGNVGVADVAIRIKPPTGIGLSVDADGVVTGGGMLTYDAVAHLYAGALQLSIHEAITVKAFGLITTRLPDGREGYSLLVFITAEDFEPVPLGLGFMLRAIGGLVAVHRSFSEDALREGMAHDTLGTLLFPKDPIGGAPALIQALGTAFPIRTGSYLLGLLARITWFTPTLVNMDLALVLELGRQRRLLVLGRISALLPSADNDLVRLKLDAVGVIDFDQGTASVDGVLVDSRLAHKFVLTGASAFRARWASGPGAGFILSVGGVNPRFAPPATLPKLSRITIALASGDNPRVTCEAYFAVTANTLQFGARASLYAAAHGFSVEADAGFDVLIQVVPFHFLADFHAAAQLKRGSRRLFKVTLRGELEGPRPLRVSGKASFEVLWCDVTVRFDKTLVGGERPPLPPAVDVAAELKRALESPANWSSQRPGGRQQGVTLVARPPGGPIAVDPLGTLVFKQQVVPLNTARDIETFGGAPVAGARRFQVSATLGARAQATRPVRDQFPPSQFFRMSDDERLASPSFEEMDAGIEFGSEDVHFDAAQAVAAPLAFETVALRRPSATCSRAAVCGNRCGWAALRSPRSARRALRAFATPTRRSRPHCASRHGRSSRTLAIRWPRRRHRACARGARRARPSGY